jgi:hypothetical protein
MGVGWPGRNDIAHRLKAVIPEITLASRPALPYRIGATHRPRPTAGTLLYLLSDRTRTHFGLSA